ncbi:RodZ domain-containing protein [Marinomonas pollencensis]|uniref:Cytoskeleton protein RodZ n=1 Tax=Marinomonas pollencensis TaxID=491954 RepID=A0A3E0DHR7_9GAMM|nr:RodZ domain-containing protein [Marinomonas pollencensis]REG82232.1 cytoskeleton protein RodZ [Marinomonas pollencensis]
MTTEFQTDVSLNDSNTTNIDIGKRLQAARIERQLDERQVSTELKIPIDQVRALEDNRFDYFRSTTFARGYLKGYCRLLGLDVNEILSAFDALTMTKAESNIKPVDKVINKQAGFGDPFVILISIVIIAVLVFLAFWWPSFSSSNSAVIDKSETPDQAQVEMQTDQQETTPNLVSPAQTETTDQDDTQSTLSQNADQAAVDSAVAKEDLPVQEETVSTGLSAETIAILEKAGVNPEKVEEATKEVPTEEIVSTPQEPLYKDDIDVAFSADCWIEVRDSSGKILYSGVKAAGSKLAVTGTAPYRVVVGYARGVSSFKFKGEVFDFSSYTHKDLARFELK